MGGRLADTSLADKVKQARKGFSSTYNPGKGFAALQAAIDDPNYTKGVELF